MLPIFNTFRSGNWSEKKINQYFGQLMFVNNYKNYIYYVPYGLAGLLFGIGIITFIVYYKKQNTNI
jgi:hypothetical protein